MSADEILEALDPDQRDVALALTGPVCVLAGAGTGKTRAITHRIAYGVRSGVYVPTSVLAVTFTARAAGEMRTRLRELGASGVQARTFHAAALRQLGYFWPKVIGGAPPRILEHKASVIASAAQRLGMSVDRVAIRDLSSEVEWAKVTLIPADDYPRAVAALSRPTPAGFDAYAVSRLIEAYEVVKNEQGVIDFEDVLLNLSGILSAHPAVADEVRRQYRRFVVDEYQDVSPLQQLLLEQWLGDRNELCVVGDPSQTIYSFTGASPHHLLNFAKQHPGTKTIRLVRDYRSTPQVVSLANALLASKGARGGFEPLELRAQRKPGPPVTFTVYDDDEAEASMIASSAGRLIASGVKASEIAILFRTNAQSEAFEQALADAGVGYLLRGGERFFGRKEVRDGILLLRAATRSVEPGMSLPEAVREVLTTAGWAPEPPAARGAARERWESMQALVALADDVAERREAGSAEAGLADFITELDERASAQHAPTVEGVTLASLHAAKGLEWDAVFLAGMSEGLLPISLAETPEAIAEEKRLLYVGITRAREHLEVSYARTRNPGGRANRRRTRFLEGLWPQDEPRPRGRGRGPVPKPGHRLTGEYDAELFTKLVEWRSSVAAGTDKPAFTVFTDLTLEAVAELQPSTVAELVRIKGIGPAKVDRFGPTLLKLVADHVG